MTDVGAVDTDKKEVIDAVYNRDPYGGIWRTDRLPWHLETPPLARHPLTAIPSRQRRTSSVRTGKRRRLQTSCRNQDTFRVADLGWGLFERCWNLRGFENILVDVMDNPDFFEEALDRIMHLYLDFVEYTADLPIDGILFGDDWGDQRGVIIGPKRWRKFLKPRWAQIYEPCTGMGKS